MSQNVNAPQTPRTRLRPSSSYVDRFCHWIVDHPALIVGVTFAITAVFAVFAMRARIDSSVETLIDPTDPAVVHYESAKKVFGTEESDVVALLAEDVFVPATLEKIRALSERLAAIEGVAEVTSLATVRTIRTTPDGDLDTSRLMPTVPTDAAGLRRLREAASTNPLISGNLVSADHRMAAILVRYVDMPDAVFVARGIHDRVEQAAAAFEGPERVFLTGAPTLKVKGAVLMRGDLLRFTPITTLVIVLVLLLSFRTLRGLLVPMVTTGVGLLCTIGLMGYLDVPIDLGTIVLPTLLTVIGSAYGTHVVARYYEELPAGGSGPDIAFRSIRHVGLPILVTAFTTVFGFATLMVFRITAIRNLGFFSVFGITTLFVLALTLAAALLALLRVPRARDGSEAGGQRLRDLLARLARFDIRHRRAIMALSAILVAVLAWGMLYVQVETNYVSYFPAGSTVRKAGDVIAEHLGGTVTLLVTIDGPGPDTIARADTLRRIATLQNFIDRLPGVDRTTSIVDYLRLLGKALGRPPTGDGFPETDAGIQQYLLLLDPELLRPVLDSEHSRAAILVRTHLHGSRDLAHGVEKIARFAADAVPSPLAVHTTGTAVLLNRTADNLSQGQLQSFGLALLVVFVVLSLQFLSFRYGLVAMVPNLIPVVGFFGILGWFDIPLSISTAMIASISIGIGVDEAVHLLSEFNHRLRRHANQERAIIEALQSVGPPVIYTTVALFLGFLVPVFSNFVPVRQFGLLSAMTVAPSLLADIVLLPALLTTARFVTLWDVLTVKLGHAPHETIRLFRGLRPAQARIAVLLGELRTVAAGERVVRRGELGGEMLVVIRGRVEVFVTSDGRRTSLGTIERGDVIGEMGFLRHAPRSADIDAIEETEVLVVNDRFLEVLERRYPRIAARVLLNLTQLMADRLERTTEQLVSRERGA